MPKFMSSHTVPAGALTREQINQIAKAAQNDPTCSHIEVFLTCRKERSYALWKLRMRELWPNGSRRCKCHVSRLHLWNWKEISASLEKLEVEQKIVIRAPTTEA